MRLNAIRFGVALALAVLAVPSVYAQQVPPVITYQGTLTDADGNAIEGTVNLAFRFYDVEEGGAPIADRVWTYNNTEIQNGRFSVPLGSEQELPTALFESSELWIEVEVNGGRLPRTRMTSTLFALQAQQAIEVVDGAIDTDALADGAVTGPKIQNGAVTEGKLAGGAVTETGLADGAVTTAKLDDEAVGRDQLATGVVVDTLNGLTGGIRLVPAGGAQIIPDAETNTITINAGSGSTNSDIQSISSPENTLTIENNSGSVSIDVANGGISTGKLEAGAVTSAKIEDGTIAGVDLASGAIFSGDNVIVIDRTGGDFEITAPNALTDAVTSLTAAEADDPLTGPVVLEGSDDIDVTQADNTLTIDFTGDLSGAVTSVESGAGLMNVGDNTTGDVELAISDQGVTGAMLAPSVIQQGDNVSVTRDNNNFVISAPDVLTQAITSFTAGGITVNNGGVELQAGDNVEIADLNDGVFEIAFDGGSSGGVTSVTGVNGLENLGATTGPVEIGIANSGVMGNHLDADVVQGSGAISVTRSNDNFVVSTEALTSAVTSLTVNATTLDGGLALIGGENITLTPNEVAESITIDLDDTGAAEGQALIFDGESADWATLEVSVDGTTITGNGADLDLALADEAVSEVNLDTPSLPGEDDVLSYNGTSLYWETRGVLGSSRRWKEDIAPLDDPVALVEALRGVRYRWKETGEADVGVIAEEVAEVLPELVAFEEDGQARGVHYAKLTAVLIEALKAQQQTIEAQQETIDEAEARFEALAERVERLERAARAAPSPR